MTEAEWLTCADPIVMLEFLRGNPTSKDSVTWWNSRWQTEGAGQGNDRKFRLFACACCRRIWDRIPEACNRSAVVAVEDFVEGYISAQSLEEALVASSSVEWLEDGSGRRPEPGYWVVKYLGRGFYKMTPAASALLISSQVIFMAEEEYGRVAGHAFNVCFYTANGVFLSPFRWPLPVPATAEAERAAQAALLHCIFGNPFRPVAFDSTLRTPNVMEVARGIYDERAFDRLPILADALEESSCHDADIMDHCRGPGPHARGCWVMDLVLGKS